MELGVSRGLRKMKRRVPNLTVEDMEDIEMESESAGPSSTQARVISVAANDKILCWNCQELEVGSLSLR